MFPFLSALFLVVLTLCISNAHLTEESSDCGVLTNGSLDFSTWDKVLRRILKPNTTIDGVVVTAVNYKELQNNSDFETFGCQVKNASGISSFTETEWKAFWINVYNYLAVSVIFKNPCAVDLFGDCRTLKSIKEVGEQQPSLFDVIWTAPNLIINGWNGNQSISLDDIEGYLRMPNDYNSSWTEDVRIHGCIVCASVSCPDLRETSYTVENLEHELKDNVERWLNNSKKGSSYADGVVNLSPIFDWFSSDFESNFPAGVNGFISTYGPADVRKNIKTATIKFFTYDWNVNGDIQGLCAANRPCFPWWALLCLLLGILVTVVVAVLCVRKRKNDYTKIQ